jgi:hypothetical protein
MLPAVHFGSFDAERKWRSPEMASLPQVRDEGAQRMIAAMEELTWGFAEAGDVVLPPLDGALADLAAGLGARVCRDLRPGTPSPYAVVPETHELVAKLGLADGLPSVTVARRVNSKTFSNDLVLSLGLEGAAQVATSTGALGELVQGLLPDGPAVVKDPYGVSGLGSLVIQDGETLDRIVGHLRRQEEAGRQVTFLVQPLLARSADFSCHFEVAADGFQAIGVQQMDNQGMSFRSVRQPRPALLDALERGEPWRHMASVAVALRREGYTGPVCVDGMVLEDGSIVPLLEINARKSMGLLHLRLRRRLDLHEDSELAVWSLIVRARPSTDRLLAVLRSNQVLFDGRCGLLPLASGTLHANLEDLDGFGMARARLYGLLVWNRGCSRERLLAGASAALEQLGAEVKGGPR